MLGTAGQAACGFPAASTPTRSWSDALERRQSLDQVANVAHLPGILCCSLAMPDIHFGYGFPIGGVAAFDVDDGVVSPGGWATTSTAAAGCWPPTFSWPTSTARIKPLVDQLFRDVPSGVGSSGAIAKLSRAGDSNGCW